MSENNSPSVSAGGDAYNVNVDGNAGQVAVGKNINQIQQRDGSVEITENDLAQVRQLFVDLKSQVEQAAPIDKKEAALERVNELEEAVTDKKPNLTTIEYVKNWFGKNLPALAGAVTGVLVNPILGKVVEAAGEFAAAEFKRIVGGA